MARSIHKEMLHVDSEFHMAKFHTLSNDDLLIYSKLTHLCTSFCSTSISQYVLESVLLCITTLHEFLHDLSIRQLSVCECEHHYFMITNLIDA